MLTPREVDRNQLRLPRHILDLDPVAVTLPHLLQQLGERGIGSLMVEGGGQVISSFIEARLVDQLIDSMNPVAPRSAGVALDNRATMPNERIAAIRAPTLILHATGDTLQLYRNAEFAAAARSAARNRSAVRSPPAS